MRILICGAGIAGLTLAWCLEKRGHHPLVVERAPQLRDEGYMLDFFGSGYDASAKMGLVGADGVHSKVRRLAFGEEPRFARFVGCYTAAFIVNKHPQAFGVTDAFVTLTVPGRQVAVYPIRGGALAAFFVHRSARHSDVFSRETIRNELREAYGRMGWLVPELLEQAARVPNIYFDAVSQIAMPSWSRDRVVLVGDACQCVSLLAGQGASMAVASAYILAEEIDAVSVRYLGTALARYEHRVRPSIERKQTAGRNMADWFVPADGLHLALRDLALRVSVWPGASAIIRRRMEGQSVFA